MVKYCKVRKWPFIFVLGLLLSITPSVIFSDGAAYGLSGDSGSEKTVLAFTSDIHNSSENTAANRLDIWLDKIEDKYGGIDVMSFCGDMGSARADESQFWDYTMSVMDVVDGEVITNELQKGVYTTGNHEFYNGQFSSTENSVRGNYVVGGVGSEGSNYIIYCLGTTGWERGQDKYTEEQIESLKDYLNGIGNDKPIIILTHFPLHSFGSGMRPRQTENAGVLIDVLNEAAGADRDKKIVLLWGHNHTVSDTYYDQIYEPGDSIEYTSGSSKELNFYYGAAGCMSDSEYGSGSAFVKGKGLVITIDSSNMLTFAYYDANANNVTEGGTYSEIPIHATGLVIDESVEEGGDGQPVTVGQTVAEGKKLQLHLTIEPEDADYRGLVWSSSDETVATVNSSGRVKGISGGKVTITAAIPAKGETPEMSASIEITVEPKDKRTAYVLTNRLEPGKNYIIANKNTGAAYALSNDDGSAGAEKVTIDGDRINASDESIVFTAEGTGDTVANFSNDGSYLNAGMGRLSFSSTPGGRPWSYGTDSMLFSKSTHSFNGSTFSSTYYLIYSDDQFTVRMARDDDPAPDAGEVYLFAETGKDPEPAPGPVPDAKPAPKPAPGSDPDQKGRDGTRVGPGASAACAEKAITFMKSDKDLKGSVFTKLKARSTKQTKSSITLKWTKNSRAVRYVVYGNKCGSKNKPKKLASVTGSTRTVKKIRGGKLKKGTYYKFIIVALDKNNNVVSTSKLIHVATKGGKVGNHKSVKVIKKVINKAKKLKKGRSLKLKAKAVAQSGKLKVKEHTGLRYESTNKKIAAVSPKGVVKAKKKGTCYIYAYAQNGIFRKIKVVVK